MTGAQHPLAGKKIVVTRARSQASSLVGALNSLGAEAIELPTIETVPLDSYDMLDEALKNIARYQWLIVTSANTVKVLAARIAALGLNPGAWTSLRKVAIGEATGRAMGAAGLQADFVPEEFVAESLIESLGDRVSGGRILLARAAVARDLLPEELARRGAIVDAIDAYRTALPKDAVDRLRQVFSSRLRLPDAVTFTSSSTANNFMLLWREAGFAELPFGVAAFSIGPVTSRTLREMGWTPTAEAEQHTVAGLVAAVLGKLKTGS